MIYSYFSAYENLKFKTPNSICYKKKEDNCDKFGILSKSNFQKDSIYALLDTISWKNSVNHSNTTGLSIQGVGYQFKKRLFIREGVATTLWLNQLNKYDEFYHVHLYDTKGGQFEKSNYITNEVFHAHPIEDLKNRRFSIRCMCYKK